MNKASSESPYFWLLLTLAMLVPFVVTLFYFVLLEESIVGKALYASLKLFTLIWPLFCYRFIWKRPMSELFHWTEESPKFLLVGFISGLLILAVMLGVLNTPLSQGIWDASEDIKKKLNAFDVLTYFWLFAFFISLIHSLIEEYYWRWFVFAELESVVRPRIAYLLATLSFTAHHVVLLSQFFEAAYVVLLSLGVAIAGLLWCVMYACERGVLSPWISHAFADVGIFAVAYTVL